MRWPDPTTDEPDTETLARWADEDTARATDGCTLGRNEQTCAHGYPSWLIVLGIESDATGA